MFSTVWFETLALTPNFCWMIRERELCSEWITGYNTVEYLVLSTSVFNYSISFSFFCIFLVPFVRPTVHEIKMSIMSALLRISIQNSTSQLCFQILGSKRSRYSCRQTYWCKSHLIRFIWKSPSKWVSLSALKLHTYLT